MSKIIDFLIPHKAGTMPAIGVVAWLPVGDKKVKFILQREHLRSEAHLLTHYASGQIVARLNSIRLARYVANPYSFPAYRDRDFATMALDGLIQTHGAEKLRAIFDNAPVVNK